MLFRFFFARKWLGCSFTSLLHEEERRTDNWITTEPEKKMISRGRRAACISKEKTDIYVHVGNGKDPFGFSVRPIDENIGITYYSVECSFNPSLAIA